MPAVPGCQTVRALMAEAVASAVPLLGICLGAQLLTLACGGAVRRGQRGPELGVLDLAAHEAAGDDRLFAGLASPSPVVQWHWEEIVTLPAGATLLASSQTYANQVFRVGDVRLGCSRSSRGDRADRRRVGARGQRDARGGRAASRRARRRGPPSRTRACDRRGGRWPRRSPRWSASARHPTSDLEPRHARLGSRGRCNT